MKIVIIHPEGNSNNNPTIKALLDLLVGKGVDVSIWYRNIHVPMPDPKSVSLFGWGTFWGKLINLIFKNLSSPGLSYLVVYFQTLLRKKEFDLIIGIDREGLIYAWCLSRIIKKPYIFFSFEIMFENETSKKFKELERLASKNVGRWFVQDRLRAEKLTCENHLSADKCTLVPVASKGVGEKGAVRLRDALGVPKEKKVAIVIGSLANWSMIPDIVNSTENWSDGWCLIIHGRYGDANHYMSRLQAKGVVAFNDKIYLSSQSPDYVDDLGFIMNGVDVGLAFYNPIYNNAYTGSNIACIGLSSGKISTYLRYGVPVILNSIGEYSHLVEVFRFGSCVNSMDDLPDALEHLNVPEASDAARDFFMNYLDFSNYEDVIWKDISSAIY